MPQSSSLSAQRFLTFTAVEATSSLRRWTVGMSNSSLARDSCRSSHSIRDLSAPWPPHRFSEQDISRIRQRRGDQSPWNSEATRVAPLFRAIVIDSPSTIAASCRLSWSTSGLRNGRSSPRATVAGIGQRGPAERMQEARLSLSAGDGGKQRDPLLSAGASATLMQLRCRVAGQHRS
jgi:hypothetical protein